MPNVLKFLGKKFKIKKTNKVIFDSIFEGLIRKSKYKLYNKCLVYFSHSFQKFSDLLICF